MMNHGMDEMMWGMGVFWLLAIAVLILLAAAAVKYLFFNTRSQHKPEPYRHGKDG